jgi:ABC-type uncharacterized transport system substrate-binding protein
VTAFGLAAAPAGAHPHIFIEAGLFVEVNAAGEAVAVEVTWTYDELYSLLIFEEYALDDDYDGVLKPDEIEQLHGFDMNWIEGFEGDLYVTGAAGKVDLGPPEPVKTWVEDGKIVTVHRRPLSVPANGLVLQAYDPGFYSAYDLSRGVEASGTCAAFIDPADIEAAMDALEELLFATPQDEVEAEFPRVGESFADTVTLTCG